MLFCYGQDEINNFLKRYFICPPDKDLFIHFYTEILSLLSPEEQEYLRKKQFHLRTRYGSIAKSILTKINSAFGISIIPKKVPLLNHNLKRFVENRELRVFTEILLLGRVEAFQICEAINYRFRLNKIITEEEIEEYAFWFFDLKLVDDLQWQRYLEKLDMYRRLFPEDRVFEIEFEDKLFALRNNPVEVLVKVGAESALDYTSMVGSLAQKTFESLQRDFSSGAQWNEIDKKIKTFIGVGEKFQKYHRPDNSGKIFESMTIDVHQDPLEMLPVFNKDEGTIVEVEYEIADEKNSPAQEDH